MVEELITYWIYAHRRGVEWHDIDLLSSVDSTIYANCCGFGYNSMDSRHPDLLTMVIL